ncbi:uncharacterized protein CANTADRAFT_26655 [Suhomyces tanzawaensis NRRL Y-17324]|uniref:Uncharacterized protein n=1 Tax=Suhomyces tanzawaensis NRRL Y-17324 TaxID=984487 RepID=A0A1E4SGM0_9ASCO|nr:uncharacterized protein CANTADRAFT_26655 [Suhomyces tanzawaensis NRRL Y-17324]ODV78626.1 hypothetical protein CANTADRAFT_26655 [Suhomyces tanzawaensis NRRL Y-17324]
MQFSTVALFAVVAAAVQADVVTKTEQSSTLVTITSCAEDVTDCPARHATAAPAPAPSKEAPAPAPAPYNNNTVTSSAAHTLAPANVTSWENAGAKNYAVGFAALAAGALLAL